MSGCKSPAGVKSEAGGGGGDQSCDEIFITDCTESCQNDNFQGSQWRKFRQNDDISVSVKVNQARGGPYGVSLPNLSLTWVIIWTNESILFCYI